MQRQKEMRQILILLGIKDIDKIPGIDELNTLYDVYKIIPPEIQRQIFDFKTLEYYACDFEDYIFEHYKEEYESDKIKQVDLNNMARILLYKYDANLSFNTLVENIAEEYLKENRLL